MLGDILHHRSIEPFEQTHTTGKTLAEVDFAAHCFFGDFAHLIAHTGAFGQLVDALGLNQCGIHIEAYQAAAAAVHCVFLKGDIEAFTRGDFHESALHFVAVDRSAAHRKLDAGFRRRECPIA